MPTKSIDVRRSPAFWLINPIMNALTSDVLNSRKSALVALSEAAAQIQSLIDEAMSEFER